MQVSEVMTREVEVISPDASLREAARKMDDLNVGVLPVCDGQRLVGIITDRDITVRATSIGESPDVTRVDEIMTGEVWWCHESDDVEEVALRMGEKQIRRIEGIINSMTPAERAKPELIKASRKRRIAAGAGVPVQAVNQLLNQFEQMQKMMKMMKGGNFARMMRGMKGMLPGIR